MTAHAKIEREYKVALPPNGARILEEYMEKRENIPGLVERLQMAQDALKQSSSIMGAYTDDPFKEARADVTRVKRVLLKNAWSALRRLYRIDEIAPVSDRDDLDRALSSPPELTPETMVELFGDYIMNPRNNQLRKLAEIFVRLDDAYKSHSKVKIGVEGLPKRIILNHMVSDGFPSRWAYAYLGDLLTSLQVFDGYGIPDAVIVSDILYGRRSTYRGLTFKLFKNGNIHVHFDEHALLQANRCLAEYYGDVLPDVEPNRDDLKADPYARTVSKDLQYYPTPKDIVETVLYNLWIKDGARVLEPSCGCGRLIQGIIDKNNRSSQPSTDVIIDAYEVHAGRVAKARALGVANVMHRNFLEVEPKPIYDRIVMNPPFYRRHYQKHIRHALKFLKPDGRIFAILPATARYDHGFIPKRCWADLPVGSFAESGTNVPTGYAVLRVDSID